MPQMNNRLVVVRYYVFIAIVRAVVALFFSSELSSPVDAHVRVQSTELQRIDRPRAVVVIYGFGYPIESPRKRLASCNF